MCDNARECAAARKQGFSTPPVQPEDGTEGMGRRQTRPLRPDEFSEILAIINQAAEAYRGVIPQDRFADPYMSREYLQSELDSGVTFFGYDVDGQLLGVMGIQDVAGANGAPDVTLIRHAYVRTDAQRMGIGSRLLKHLMAKASRPVMIGTWADAQWAIDFYAKHGFRLTEPDEGHVLLRTYWDITARQVEISVVLVEADAA